MRDAWFWQLGSAGILVMLSWMGWGWLLWRCMGRTTRQRGEWAMCAACGMAEVLFLGGVATCCGVTSVALLASVTLCGALLAIGAWGSAVLPWRDGGIGRFRWVAPLVVMGAGLFAHAVQSTNLNPGDDTEAYMVFPKQMLESGTLLAPFSIRRMATYGGHQLLQAQWMAAVRMMWGKEAESLCITHGHLIDAGLCPLIAAGLLWELMRPRDAKKRALALMVVASFLLMPIPRVNTHAQMSGTVLFLALARLLPLLGKGGRRRIWRWGAVAGLLAAGVATLRMNFVAGAGIVILLAGILRNPEWRRLRGVVRVLWPAMVMVALLLPWAIVLMRSSGTWMYPLMRGNETGRFLGEAISVGMRGRLTVLAMLYPPVLMLLLPVVLAWDRRWWRDALPLYGGGILTTAALAWSFLNQETINSYRLSSPMLIACAWFTLAIMAKRWSRQRREMRWATVALLIAIPCVEAINYSDSFRHSYPLLLLPALLLAVWASTVRQRAVTRAVAVAVIAILWWTAFLNHAKLVDNGSVFFFGITCALLVYTGMATKDRLLRGAAMASAAGIGVMAAAACLWIQGAELVGMAIVLGAGVLAIGRVLQKGRFRYRGAVIALLVALIVGSAFVNLPYVEGTLGNWVFLAAVAALTWIAWRTSVLPVRWIAIAGVTVLLLAGTPSLPSSDRYAASIMAMGMTAGIAWILMRLRIHPVAMALVLGCGALAVGVQEFSTFAESVPPRALDMAPIRSAYMAAQAAIPRGARFYAITPSPVYFDFGRNRVDVPDYGGEFSSPPPGLPLRASASALCDYWKALGIQYVVLARSAFSPGDRQPTTFQRNLRQLAETKRIVFRSPELLVIDLGR